MAIKIYRSLYCLLVYLWCVISILGCLRAIPETISFAVCSVVSLLLLERFSQNHVVYGNETANVRFKELIKTDKNQRNSY